MENLWLEPTNQCNLECEHCFQKVMTRPRGYMEYDLYRKIIDECQVLGMKTLTMVGWGEPLLHPHICTMIEYARTKNIFVSLPTNATLLDRKKRLKLLKAGINRVKFGLDGMKDSYEKTRGVSYARTHDNIERFIKLAQRKVETVMVMTVHESNVQDMKEYYHYWSTKASRVEFQRQVKFTGKRTRPCTVLGVTFNVWWNGDVVPCCVDYNGYFKLGNLNQKSMLACMRSPVLKDLMNKNVNRVYPGPCSSCTEFENVNLPYQLR